MNTKSDPGAEIVAVTKLLDDLRWKPDMVITNYAGERVWLKEAYLNGQRVGVTDCCLADDPCDWHSALQDAVGSLQGDWTAGC